VALLVKLPSWHIPVVPDGALAGACAQAAPVVNPLKARTAITFQGFMLSLVGTKQTLVP
jgi:hypothetical protein